jgi:hypothetical protein
MAQPAGAVSGCCNVTLQTATSEDSMSAHTPTPWRYETEHTYGHATVYGKGRKSGQHKQHVAQVWSGGERSMRVAEANAAIIVRAVNAHDELVAALSALLDYCAGNVPYFGDKGDASREAFDRACAALAKAETP